MRLAVAGIAYDEAATGGTLFANALSMAAARAALTEVLTREAFITTARLGEKLAAGLRAHIDRAGLPWSVNVHGSHACYFFSPQPPRDARGARDTDDSDLRALIRLFLANRGVWESGWWLGPTVGVAHTRGRGGVPRRDWGVHRRRGVRSSHPMSDTALRVGFPDASPSQPTSRGSLSVCRFVACFHGISDC